jgi:hypothetical protein
LRIKKDKIINYLDSIPSLKVGWRKIIRIHMDVLKIATAGSVDDGKVL